MDANKVLENFINELNYQIASEKDSSQFSFILNQYQKGNVENDDLVEIRGYYKGLKVAKEILQKHMAIQEELENEEDDEDE